MAEVLQRRLGFQVRAAVAVVVLEKAQAVAAAAWVHQHHQEMNKVDLEQLEQWAAQVVELQHQQRRVYHSQVLALMDFAAVAVVVLEPHHRVTEVHQVVETVAHKLLEQMQD